METGLVNTVTGEIRSAHLGWTMPLEHIVVACDGTFLDGTPDIDLGKDHHRHDDDRDGARCRKYAFDLR